MMFSKWLSTIRFNIQSQCTECCSWKEKQLWMKIWIAYICWTCFRLTLIVGTMIEVSLSIWEYIFLFPNLIIKRAHNFYLFSYQFTILSSLQTERYLKIGKYNASNLAFRCFRHTIKHVYSNCRLIQFNSRKWRLRYFIIILESFLSLELFKNQKMDINK